MVAAVVKTHKQLTKAKKEELEINEEQYTWSVSAVQLCILDMSEIARICLIANGTTTRIMAVVILAF